MVMLMNAAPDKVEQLNGGQYRFTFASGRDINKLPIDAEYWVVYSPSFYQDKWRTVRFRIMPGKRNTRHVGIVQERKLNTDEVVYFENLVAWQGR
jgi:hypothetical protein